MHPHKAKHDGWFRRAKRKIKRLIRRYGCHPAKAIYHESLRRRYVRLGRWLERRKEAQPAIVHVQQATPILLPPPKVILPTGEWLRIWHATHPQTGPLHKIELVPDHSPHTGPISRIDTQLVTEEETARYKALPKFLRE